MSAYEALAPAVRAVVDRQAEAHVQAHGGELDDVREAIAVAVRSTTSAYTNGTGH